MSISRILYLLRLAQKTTGIYLGRKLLCGSSGTLLRLVALARESPKSTALHPGKDLVVALPTLLWELARAAFRRRGRPLSLEKRRLCSHLLDYSGRALPATLLLFRFRKKAGVRTFLPALTTFAVNAEHLSDTSSH